MKKMVIIAVMAASVVLMACQTNKTTAENPEAQNDTISTGKVCGHNPQNLKIYFDDADSGVVYFTDTTTNESWTGTFEKTGEDGWIIRCDK